MTTDDKIDLRRALTMAQDEIQRLRHQNEILSAKVGVMDLFGLVFRTQPAYATMGMSEDPVWLIDKQLMKLTEADIASNTSRAA